VGSLALLAPPLGLALVISMSCLLISVIESMLLWPSRLLSFPLGRLRVGYLPLAVDALDFPFFFFPIFQSNLGMKRCG
jgi:hypothetical protein